jgi:hypothetical protein
MFDLKRLVLKEEKVAVREVVSADASTKCLQLSMSRSVEQADRIPLPKAGSMAAEPRAVQLELKDPAAAQAIFEQASSCLRES